MSDVVPMDEVALALPGDLRQTTCAIRADEARRRRENTVRVYMTVNSVASFKSAGNPEKNLDPKPMQCVNGTVIGILPLTTPTLGEEYSDILTNSSSWAKVPRLKKVEGSKKYVLVSPKPGGPPPCILEQNRSITLFMYAGDKEKLTVGYDIIMVDLFEFLLPALEKRGESVQLKVDSMSVVPSESKLGGCFRQRLFNLIVMGYRFKSVSYFRSVFDAYQKALTAPAPPDAESDVYFEPPSGVLVVFGGSPGDDGTTRSYHDTGEGATYCSIGWNGLENGDPSRALATGPATTTYRPSDTAPEKAPMEATFVLSEYRAGHPARQTTQTVAIFRPREGCPPLLPGASFSLTAKLLTNLGKHIKAVLCMKGQWSRVTDLVPLHTSFAGFRPEPAKPAETTNGVQRVEALPKASATIGSLFDFSDLVLSPSAVIISAQSPLVANALAGKIAANATVAVHSWDLHELKMGVVGATVAVAKEMNLADIMDNPVYIWYVVDIRGCVLGEEALKTLAKLDDAIKHIIKVSPESERRAAQIAKLHEKRASQLTDYMQTNMLVMVTCARPGIHAGIAAKAVADAEVAAKEAEEAAAAEGGIADTLARLPLEAFVPSVLVEQCRFVMQNRRQQPLAVHFDDDDDAEGMGHGENGGPLAIEGAAAMEEAPPIPTREPTPITQEAVEEPKVEGDHPEDDHEDVPADGRRRKIPRSSRRKRSRSREQ